MKIATLRKTPRQDGTIALINIVFLLLVFFLIAGTMAPPLSSELRLAQSMQAMPANRPNALVVLPDGTLIFRGEVIDLEHFLSTLAGAATKAPLLQIAADRALPAQQLLDLLLQIKKAGDFKVRLITQRQSQ